MSQTSITSFFNSRKRPATDEILSSKNKIPHIERNQECGRILLRSQLLKSSHIVKDVKQSPVPVDEIKQVKVEDVKASSSNVVENRSESISEPLPHNAVFSKKTNTVNILKTSEPTKSEVTVSARKELSLGDIRKKLSGSSRLAEIKAAAERLSKGIHQLKETTEKKNLKEFKCIDVEVPSSPSKKLQLPNEFSSPQKKTPVLAQRSIISPRKVYVSPIKSPNKVPAYIRHASLATSSTSLPLPHHYRFLSELFRGMETVVAMLYNRNEKITFTKLKPSVQEMLKRTFNEKHLAQIKHLVPDFYNFEVQKIKNFSASCHKEAYELVITPNIPHNINIMNPTVMLERRRYFYDTLLQLVKKHHTQYLLTLDPPMVIPNDKLSRWHPEFEIEKVPEIESAKLPEMPNAEKFSSAQDVLSKARELFKCNTKMERALEKLAQAKNRGLTEEEKAATATGTGTGITTASTAATGITTASNSTLTSQPSTSNVTILNPALRNLPASLLEKVKAKQAAKALEAMTRTSDHDKKYLIYSRLPDLARTLRNIFVTERKNVLALNIILSKLESSFKANISASDLQRDIESLSDEVPDFVKLHNIRNSTYLKLDKNADLKKITSKLDALAAKYRND